MLTVNSAVTTAYNGVKAYKEHLDGQRHKKKESSLKTTVTTTAAVTTTTTASAIVVSRAGAVQLHCQLCDVACAGADTYAAHIRGIKHQKVCALILLLLQLSTLC